MFSPAFIAFPKLLPNQKEEFSGLLSEDLGAIEKTKVKKFLANFCFGALEGLESYMEELRSMSPKLRFASMKYLVSLFDLDNHQHMVKYRIAWAMAMVSEMAKLPSEVKDGITLSKKLTTPYFNYLKRDPSAGDSLTQIAVSLTTLVKKMEVFELSEVRLRQKKTEVVKFLVDIIALYNVDGNISEKIMECVNSICEAETGLQEILEKANGNDLAVLLGETEAECRGLVDVQTLVVRGGSQTFETFGSKWINEADTTYRAQIRVDLEANGLCYVELIAHYLNTQVIIGPIVGTEIKAFLFGLNKSGTDCLMLTITLNVEDLHSAVKGLVAIRSSSEDLCDLARSKVLALETNPRLMKF